MRATTELLKTFKLFRNLGDSELERLCVTSSVVRVARRGVVLSAGSDENKVALLFEGRLQGVDFTIDGREVGLYFVEQGDYCGELNIFESKSQPEHIIALNSVVVVLINADVVREVASRNPEIMLELGQKLASRIRQMTNQRSLLSLTNVSQRVCNQLWMIAEAEGAKPLKSKEVTGVPTHMEFAIMLNLSRETVTRVFQQLQKKQIVSRKGPNKLMINDLIILREIAKGSKQL